MTPTPRHARGPQFMHTLWYRRSMPLLGEDMEPSPTPLPLIWCETPRPEPKCRCGQYQLVWDEGHPRPEDMP